MDNGDFKISDRISNLYGGLQIRLILFFFFVPSLKSVAFDFILFYSIASII